MVQESIRIGMSLNLRSQRSFNSNVYHYLSENTDFLKLYVCRATMVAKSKLKYYRKMVKKKPNFLPPNCKKPYVIIDRQSYRITGTTLLVGLKPQRP